MARQGQHKADHHDPSGQPNPGMGTNDPESFERDLHPDSQGAQNFGLESEATVGSAYDVKDLTRELPNLTNYDLKQIPVVNEGERLEQGAVYFDLNDPARGEIKARGDMVAERGSRLVPKSGVDYQLWNALIGVRNPERLGFADEGATAPSAER